MGQVGDDGRAGDVFAQRHGKPGRGLLELLAFQQLPQMDGCCFPVRHLDADGGPAGDGRLNPDLRGGQGQGQVVGQPDDAAHLDPRRRLDFVAGDGRTNGHLRYAGRDAEAGQGFLQDADLLVDFLVGNPGFPAFCRGQQRCRRKLAGFAAAPGKGDYLALFFVLLFLLFFGGLPLPVPVGCCFRAVGNNYFFAGALIFLSAFAFPFLCFDFLKKEVRNPVQGLLPRQGQAGSEDLP